MPVFSIFVTIVAVALILWTIQALPNNETVVKRGLISFVLFVALVLILQLMGHPTVQLLWK